MQLVRHHPLAVSRSFGPQFDDWFDGWFGDSSRAWAPRVDVLESDGALVARFEVAGFSAEDLEVTLEDGVLSLTGERRFESEDATFRRRELAYGSFRRSVRVGDAYDADQVTASYKDGILEVTIAKRPEVLPRKIEISTAG